MCFRTGCWRGEFEASKKMLREAWQNYTQRSSTVYIFNKHHRDEIKVGETGKICYVTWVRGNMQTKFQSGNLSGRFTLSDLNVDNKINLKNIWRYRLDSSEQRNQWSELVQKAMNNVIADMLRPMFSEVVTGTIHIQQWEPLLASNSPISIPNYVYELFPWDGRSRAETSRKITL